MSSQVQFQVPEAPFVPLQYSEPSAPRDRLRVQINWWRALVVLLFLLQMFVVVWWANRDILGPDFWAVAKRAAKMFYPPIGCHKRR